MQPCNVGMLSYYYNIPTTGSRIHHDLWPVYDRIPNLPVVPPYTEEGVNHSREFVTATGVTTNHAEV